MKDNKNSFFYSRTETDTKITIVWKPTTFLFQFAPLLFCLLFSFTASLFLESLFTLLSSLSLILFFINSIVVIVKMRNITREINAALKNNSVQANGRKYSFSNPLTYIIDK